MVEVKGKGGISVKIIADSVNPLGKRITTYELEYPRFIHAEFMTHRLFSRNAASSRAIPVPKMIENIENNTAMPIHWGANQPGMQADNECDNFIAEYGVEFNREDWWGMARDMAITYADRFHESGYHKQIVNRLLEPFQFIKVVCTATEYDNFFWLRNHKDAQPEIKELARCMWEAKEQSKPNKLKVGEWHVPYYNQTGVWRESLYGKFNTLGELSMTDGKNGHTLETALKISASCCAQVSYRLTDNSVEKALKIYDMLVNSKPVHASPFEHQAEAMDENTTIDTEGVTGYNKSLGFYSGNFFGWIQHRQLIDENTCWSYEPE